MLNKFHIGSFRSKQDSPASHSLWIAEKTYRRGDISRRKSIAIRKRTVQHTWSHTANREASTFQACQRRLYYEAPGQGEYCPLLTKRNWHFIHTRHHVRCGQAQFGNKTHREALCQQMAGPLSFRIEWAWAWIGMHHPYANKNCGRVANTLWGKLYPQYQYSQVCAKELWKQIAFWCNADQLWAGGNGRRAKDHGR